MRASFKIAHFIARELRPFSTGPFVKECLDIASESICPLSKPQFNAICLSRHTIARRIEDLSADVERQLTLRGQQFIAYSLCLDESTDVVDTAQLAIFIRGVDIDLNITEELLDLIPMRDTCTGEDIFCAVEHAIDNMNPPWNKLVSVATDGTPNMIGCNVGFVGLLKSKLTPGQKFHSVHCVIHQEALCAKTVQFDMVMNVVVKTVNFIRSVGLNHRQFRELMDSLESDFNDIPYFCQVRWLSRGKTLERFLLLLDQVKLFMDMKGRHVPELSDPQWIVNLAFVTDITSHLNALNGSLQGKAQLIVSLCSKIRAMQMKL